MTRPPYGVGPQQGSHGSPYAEPVRSPYAEPPQSPYASASPYAEPFHSPYAESPQSPYAYPGSPYAEPVRKPDYLRPRQRVQIPVQPPPRRWPWMLTAAVSLVVIAIAVAVMFKNLSEPNQAKAQAGQTRPSTTISEPPRTPTSSTQPLPTGDEQDSTADAPEDTATPTEDTVEITPEHTPTTTKAKPPTSATPEPEEGEARIPKVRGRNAQDVQDQLRELGFTNIQLVPDDPASGLVLFAAGWKAVSVDPGPGQIADVTDAVVVRCVPLNN
ncbi:MAG: hypothetical protein ACRC20_05290 [Segniliparus sp.]|uniref:PASTA domain-containing protein n=1 Tax=Segniliparus sp. TaxID=2804064 RepID=UPI003F304503